jgi:hypothetical protein
MVILRWVVFSFLMFFGGWAIVANWVIPFRKGGGSLIPLVGGSLVAVAFAVVPVDVLNSLWWVPLFVDLGCVPLFTLTGGHLLWRAASKKENDQQPPPVP